MRTTPSVPGAPLQSASDGADPVRACGPRRDLRGRAGGVRRDRPRHDGLGRDRRRARAGPGRRERGDRVRQRLQHRARRGAAIPLRGARGDPARRSSARLPYPGHLLRRAGARVVARLVGAPGARSRDRVRADPADRCGRRGSAVWTCWGWRDRLPVAHGHLRAPRGKHACSRRTTRSRTRRSDSAIARGRRSSISRSTDPRSRLDRRHSATRRLAPSGAEAPRTFGPRRRARRRAHEQNAGGASSSGSPRSCEAATRVSYVPLIGIVDLHAGRRPRASLAGGRLRRPGARTSRRSTDAADGRVLIVPPGSRATAEDMLEPFDGLLLAGGGDVDPPRYGGSGGRPSVRSRARARRTRDRVAARRRRRGDCRRRASVEGCR